MALKKWLEKYESLARHHQVDAGGYTVSWRQFGEGEPLVLLHGGHGSWLHWARNIDALSKKYSVWLPDLPGYGDSSAPRFDAMPGMVAAMLANLDQVFGANVAINLCGFSFGGLVSAHLAAQRPLVSKLALLGPGGHGGPRRPRGELINWKRAENDEVLKRAMRHNLWVHMIYADEQIDPLALGIHAQSCVQTRFRSKGLSAKAELQEALDAYGGETLLVWGEHDVTATPAILIERLIKPEWQRTAKVIPGVGHWVQYEASEEVDVLLSDWFA